MPRRALALCLVPSWQALGVHPARSVVPARVDPFTTRDRVRHGAETWEAFAHRVSLSIDFTLSVWTTWGGETGIRWRSSGFGDSVAASDCVRHGAVAGEAGANGVALPVDVALRIPPTRARHARVWPGHALVVAAHHVRPAVWISFAFSTTSSDGVRLRDVGG